MTEQQEIIRQRLETKGYLLDPAPEGVLSILGLAEKFDVSYPVIVRAIKDLLGQLGKTIRYRFGTSTVTAGFTTEQQEMIRQRLEESGFFSRPPEGVITMGELARKLGFTYVGVGR